MCPLLIVVCLARWLAGVARSFMAGRIDLAFVRPRFVQSGSRSAQKNPREAWSVIERTECSYFAPNARRLTRTRCIIVGVFFGQKHGVLKAIDAVVTFALRFAGRSLTHPDLFESLPQRAAISRVLLGELEIEGARLDVEFGLFAINSLDRREVAGKFVGVVGEPILVGRRGL